MVIVRSSISLSHGINVFFGVACYRLLVICGKKFWSRLVPGYLEYFFFLFFLRKNTVY